MITTAKTGRIDVVDALRGFAIMSILLLHNIEHFDYAFFPEYLPEGIKSVDKVIWDTLFFLFGGKSYSIFALLFGLTFFIQDSHQQAKGHDFRGRFAWRLLLLAVFAFVNSMFYQGDILTFFAVLGFLLIPVSRLSDGIVIAIAAIFLLQPYEIGSIIYMAFNPDYVYPPNTSWKYFAATAPFFEGNSIIEMIKCNLTIGKTAVVYWNWENGRMFQAPALFMLGMVLGRKSLFVDSEQSHKFWKRTLIIGILAFAAFFTLKNCSVFGRDDLSGVAKKLFNLWSNLSFTAILVSGFVLLYRKNACQKVLNYLIPFGKMSLSNYMMQSCIGFFVYYGCGLALYQYTGALYSLGIGIVLMFLQWYFCYWYLKGHKHGPLEYVWHKLTWIGSDR